MLAPQGPRPRPKTVSQLLREKRLREAPARKATLGPVALAPQLLISSSVVLQQPLPPARQSPPALSPTISSTGLSGSVAPTAASTSASGSRQELGTSAKDEDQRLPASRALSLAPTLGSGQVPAGRPLSSLGQSQAPTATRRPDLPEVPPFLPAAPSPAQLPLQPLGLTPALATSIPLPVTWVLTAQGLLPVQVPAVLGLPKQGEMPAPRQGPAPPPPPTETPAPSHQPLASVGTEAAPSSRTDPSGPPACPLPQTCTEACADLGVLGEAQVARPASVPRMTSQADSPETGAPRPGQLPAGDGRSPRKEPGGVAVAGSRPLGLERPPLPGPEKRALDLGLLCLDSEAATWEWWLRGQRGVCISPLETRLPYQPPGLCSLRALSRLLLRRAALERKASSLVLDRVAGPAAWQASLELVRRQLQDNPAYLLLKARFLAVFTLPALLATLPPDGVPTTLSAATRTGPDDEDLSELEPEDGDRDEQPHCISHGTQARSAPRSPMQGTPSSGEGFVSCLDASDDLDVLRTRHGRHARKRRWQQ